MHNWQMLTLVGEDRPGIVAQVTDALYQAGFNLGAASMLRLGENFTIMLMIQGAANVAATLEPVASTLGLRFHIDPSAETPYHQQQLPNLQVRVAGADRAGIVAQVTTALAAHGFNILELESNLAGSNAKPIYIMHIQGYSTAKLENLQAAVAQAVGQNVDVSVDSINIMLG